MYELIWGIMLPKELSMKRYILMVMLASLSYGSDTAHEIAQIPEASGISYCADSDTLVVANDEGWYYEIDTSGAILHKHRARKYDLEGVHCEPDRFVFAIEDRGILLINRKTNKTKLIEIDTAYRNKKLKLFDKKRGIEGITKVGDTYYLAKQAKKKKDSIIVALKLSRFGSKIVDVIKPKIADIAGLIYHNGILYMVSDKKDLLIKYNLQKKKIIEKIKLPKTAQEGITFDSKGFAYIADDDGAVLKYRF